MFETGIFVFQHHIHLKFRCFCEIFLPVFLKSNVHFASKSDLKDVFLFPFFQVDCVFVVLLWATIFNTFSTCSFLLSSPITSFFSELLRLLHAQLFSSFSGVGGQTGEGGRCWESARSWSAGQVQRHQWSLGLQLPGPDCALPAPGEMFCPGRGASICLSLPVDSNLLPACPSQPNW